MEEQKNLEEKICRISSEKDRYLTIFESLPNPVILANEKNQFEYMNHAAALLFENSSACGALYKHQADEEMAVLQPNSSTGTVHSCLPWLDVELADFAGGPALSCSFEKSMPA